MPRSFFHQRALMLAATLLCACSWSWATEAGNWLIYFGHQPLSGGFTLWNEAQLRQRNLIGDVQQGVLRVGVGYTLPIDSSAGSSNVLLGYGFFHAWSSPSAEELDTNKPSSTIEHRLFQQFIHQHRVNRTVVQHRFRLEERWLPDSFAARFRYFLALNVPISRPTMDGGVFYGSVYNEIFLVPTNAPIDRNRIYAAIGYVVQPGLRTEVGWMTQFTGAGTTHQLQLVVFNALPW